MIFCTQCGNPLPEQSKFCGKCGVQVDDFNVPVQETAGSYGNSQGIAQTIPANRLSGLAIASYAVSLFGILWFGVICGLVSVGLGIAALPGCIRRKTRGTGLAIAGLSIGVFEIIVMILYL